MLTIEGLNTHYGASHVLQGVDLAVSEGRICSVLGRNGVGKTTTLRTVMGLVPPSAGRVWLDGADITGWPPHRVARAGVAYVPEGRLIFPDLTVVENIRVAERRPSRTWPLPRLMELFPPLRERAASRGGTLSGGEQQMLAIARGLMAQPRLLMLDEPSWGIAPKFVTKVLDVIQRVNETGVTVLLVEQNLHKALSIAHHGYVIQTGRIVMQGSGSELAANDDVKKAYLGL